MARRKKILVAKVLEPLIIRLDSLGQKLPEKVYRGLVSNLEGIAEVLASSFLSSVGQEQGIGEAYYFSRTYTPPDEFREGLGIVADMAGVRRDLELTVFDDLDEVPDDANLRECAECITQECYRDKGRPVVLGARVPGENNQVASKQLGMIIGTLCNWSDINDDVPIKMVESAGDKYIKAGSRYIEHNFS